ncbi:MAG: diaminopimelate epimerase [Deferribacterota bacterium]|nr:diaminopimelate epimerase [Deferribacterota bacterium]
MKEIKFWKMSGAGNDFIIINNIDNSYNNFPFKKYISKLCKRGLSIGADGVVIIKQSKVADIAWEFYNSDGSIAEMCGNAARCVSKFAYLNNITSKRLTIETLSGIINSEVIDDYTIKTELPPPKMLKLDYKITLDDKDIAISSINTGVPHVIIFEENIENVDLINLGRSIRYNSLFKPRGTNVNICEIVDENTIKIRTYERGVENETLACGTGALACAIISSHKFTKYPITVLTKGGTSLIVLKNNGKYYIQAEARIVCKGKFNHEAYTY